MTKIKCRPGTTSVFITHHGRQPGVVEESPRVYLTYKTGSCNIVLHDHEPQDIQQ